MRPGAGEEARAARHERDAQLAPIQRGVDLCEKTVNDGKVPFKRDVTITL